RRTDPDQALELVGAVSASIADEALGIVRARDPCRLGELIDEAFTSTFDESSIGVGSRIQDNRAFLQNKLPVGRARPLGRRRSDLGRRRCGDCGKGKSWQ
ncbi:hypothetical protein, partial [Microvirga brassicacearum]|uniref:hypothetical protein n=1 Tax=Microvirga brassicacearum TaxID=2580413 RepID=UPI001AED2BAD